MKTNLNKKTENQLKNDIIFILQAFTQERVLKLSSNSKANDYCGFLLVNLKTINKLQINTFLKDYILLLECENVPVLKIKDVLLIYKLWIRDRSLINVLISLFSKINIKYYHSEFYDAIFLIFSKYSISAFKTIDILIILFKGIECNKQNLSLCLKTIDLWSIIVQKIELLNRVEFIEEELKSIKNFVLCVKGKIFNTSYEKIDFLFSHIYNKGSLNLRFPILLNKKNFFNRMKVISQLPKYIYMNASLSEMLHFSKIYSLCPDFFNARIKTFPPEKQNANFNEIIAWFFEDYHFPKVLISKYIYTESENNADMITWLFKGNNLRNYSNLPISLTKRASHFITTLYVTEEFIEICTENFNVNRILYYAQLRVNGANIDFAKEASKILENKAYITDKNQWINHFTKLNKIGITHIELENCVDYLNYIGNFSVLKNISKDKLLDDVNYWHELLSSSNYSLLKKNLKLPNYGVKGFEFIVKDEKYFIKQIMTTRELLEEGITMKHCVFSHLQNCLKSKLAIYSLQKTIGSLECKRLLTIELVLKSIVQARGKCNRLYTSEELNIMKMWASQENLKIAV